MNRTILLPKLALSGIRKNGIVYLPYILTIIFAAAIYFCFSSIVANPMLKNVPYSGYAIMLLIIGKYLLGLVLIPFLIYTNSFLFKRRKKEMGLYTVLGLEKKHVGIMMILESLLLFILSVGGGFLTAIVFSKLLFLIMLKMSNMPSDTGFVLTSACFIDTCKLFGFIFVLNLSLNLFQIIKMNSTELLQSGKKGEKEPKFLALYSVLGILFLAAGYGVSISAKLDSMIFIKFPIAIILVILGTYFIFTAGIIQLLKHLKKNTALYYQKENFVTISGMLYRMKKSAASLVNICLFSTMIIITLTCTVALTVGEKDAIAFFNAYDASYTFRGENDLQKEAFLDRMQQEATAEEVTLKNTILYSYGSLDMTMQGNVLQKDETDGMEEGDCCVRVLPYSVYQTLTNSSDVLNQNECLVFFTSGEFEDNEINLCGQKYQVKENLKELSLDNKNIHSVSHKYLYMIVSDEAQMHHLCSEEQLFTSVLTDLEGKEENKREFLKQTSLLYVDQPDAFREQNIFEYADKTKSMDGGLLFIGVFFGLVFAVSLLLVMYYKQISEGLEDQDSFHIMKKVGMGSQDIESTIKRQILLVFALPAFVAILHIAAALPMLINLMYALNLYHTFSTILSTVIVVAAFLIFYVFCYFLTAKTYYKIVQ